MCLKLSFVFPVNLSLITGMSQSRTKKNRGKIISFLQRPTGDTLMARGVVTNPSRFV